MTYTQVLWFGRSEKECTWEPATSLSPVLIQEFENGIVSETSMQKSRCYGNTSSNDKSSI